MFHVGYQSGIGMSAIVSTDGKTTQNIAPVGIMGAGRPYIFAFRDGQACRSPVVMPDSNSTYYFADIADPPSFHFNGWHSAPTARNESISVWGGPDGGQVWTDSGTKVHSRRLFSRSSTTGFSALLMAHITTGSSYSGPINAGECIAFGINFGVNFNKRVTNQDSTLPKAENNLMDGVTSHLTSHCYNGETVYFPNGAIFINAMLVGFPTSMHVFDTDGGHNPSWDERTVTNSILLYPGYYNNFHVNKVDGAYEPMMGVDSVPNMTVFNTYGTSYVTTLDGYDVFLSIITYRMNYTTWKLIQSATRDTLLVGNGCFLQPWSSNPSSVTWPTGTIKIYDCMMGRIRL